ncbi:type I-MYXAN CRISPR-associated protein Cas6/Cmx6 [Phormidium sp. CCY1219]|uniref:type I-MYXAN CRISPR-associated protein Cas6/Cmx6 n=1 Tax=Phormidium sp. CCY1219 TaxID=2886104 RepID=UPI002D1E80BD|nr:type I-MYXAN CRISPR-associated protein Cas6/Cmx6 [Phormidium sp. CCY1219]MEB3828827.1 type I-MYXAN CRISPR-associated protein Cas6/Cmx6 [Phormidium sp. CCY1219]
MLTLHENQPSRQGSKSPYVELSFGITGESLPADHGYGLLAAISHLVPELHGIPGLSIETIMGIPDRQGKITLTERSRLRIRLSTDRVDLACLLAGKKLTIGNSDIWLHIPQILLLQPAARLRSRIVTIKGYQDPEPFLEAAQRQLEQLGIQGTLAIPLNAEGEPARKAIKIKKYSVVGFGLEIIDLTEEHSLQLQAIGLGGKRRMGCGIFVPFRRF